MSIPTPVKPKIGAQRIWRNIWGILALLSILWIIYGYSVSGQAYNETVGETASEGYKAGAALGAGMGIAVFLCTGGFVLLFSLILYARNGAAITKAKQHAETLNAIQQSKQ